MQIGVIGAGRIGTQLARSLSLSNINIKIIDHNWDKASALAKKVQGQAIDSLINLDIVFLALPGEVILDFLLERSFEIQPGQIFVNLATSLTKDTLHGWKREKQIKLVSAKIVGHAFEIGLGDKPAVLIDGKDPERAIVANILQDFGICSFGDERIVQKINSIATKEGIDAAVRIKSELDKLGISEDLTNAAIRNVAAGSMKAFTRGDLGPFALKVVEELENK